MKSISSHRARVRLWQMGMLACLILPDMGDPGRLPVAQVLTPAQAALIVTACPDGVTATLITGDDQAYAQVRVAAGGATHSLDLVNSSYDGAQFTEVYSTALTLQPGQTGTVQAVRAGGDAVQGSFIVDACGRGYPHRSVRGSTFLDRNSNGQHDEGEPGTFTWFKLTDGGSWFVCGYTGDDGTFGVPVNAGVFFLVPVTPKGFRASTPARRVVVRDASPAALGTDIGLVPDPAAPLQSCDAYHP